VLHITRCGALKTEIQKLKEKLVKIEFDIKNGLKFKAADRLINIRMKLNYGIVWLNCIMKVDF